MFVARGSCCNCVPVAPALPPGLLRRPPFSYGVRVRRVDAYKVGVAGVEQFGIIVLRLSQLTRLIASVREAVEQRREFVGCDGVMRREAGEAIDRPLNLAGRCPAFDLEALRCVDLEKLEGAVCVGEFERRWRNSIGKARRVSSPDQGYLFLRRREAPDTFAVGGCLFEQNRVVHPFLPRTHDLSDASSDQISHTPALMRTPPLAFFRTSVQYDAGNGDKPMRITTTTFKKSARVGARTFRRDYFGARPVGACWTTAVIVAAFAGALAYSIGMGGTYGELVVTNAQFALIAGLTGGAFEFCRHGLRQAGFNAVTMRLAGECALVLAVAAALVSIQMLVGG